MDFQDIDIKKIQFTEFPQKYSKQNILYPNIDGRSIVFKTPWIQLDQYGLQRKNQYFPDDNKRNFIKIPHSRENEDFSHFLKSIDMRLLKDESILNKKDKIYCSLVKANNNPDYKDFTKLNFLVDYVTQQFNTKIYIDKVDQNIKTINDLEQLPLYMSNVRFIVKITKLWYNNNMYGLKLGLLQMQIKPNENKKENKYDEYAFD